MLYATTTVTWTGPRPGCRGCRVTRFEVCCQGVFDSVSRVYGVGFIEQNDGIQKSGSGTLNSLI